MPRLESRIPPWLLVAAFTVAIALVSVHAPLVHIPIPGHGYAAAALVFFGLALAAVGVLQFRRNPR